MNTWLVHILLTPLVRLPIEVDARDRDHARGYGIEAAEQLGVTYYDVEVKEIIA